jgi:alkanesulfonate monooxygenase
MYPRAASQYAEQPLASGVRCGIRVGIIARESDAEAWTVARQRFPQDRKGQLKQQMAMKVSDSKWHKQLSALAEDLNSGSSPYWLWPFENYKSFCPYIVGSYVRVAEEIGRYVALGAGTFILDIPPTEEELFHTCKAFNLVHDRPMAQAQNVSPGTAKATTAASDPS